MLILLLQQETGVPIPGAAQNKQMEDAHTVSNNFLLRGGEACGDNVAGNGTVASVPQLDNVAYGVDNMSASECYWADSESNKDMTSDSLSTRL